MDILIQSNNSFLLSIYFLYFTCKFFCWYLPRRDALAAELLNAQQELLELKSQIENSSGNSSEVQNLQNTKGNNFVANWEVIEYFLSHLNF